jgi:hypothetical protein
MSLITTLKERWSRVEPYGTPDNKTKQRNFLSYEQQKLYIISRFGNT